MPEAGSQPSQSEKITISTMPSQNTGMLAPKSDATALSRSRSELRARGGGDAERDAAERGEEERARREHERGLVAVEHLVEHGALHPERAAEVAARDVADPAEVLDVERLGRGRARCAGASRSSCVAWEPSMISAGSPGERCRTRKTTTDTPSSTGTSSRSRRAR